MYLKKVTLKNFRCFEHIDVDLHPQLTVLVGVNGAGKTAILDGIAVGLAPILSQLSSANQRLSTVGAKILDTDFRLVPAGRRGNSERWVASDFTQVIVETTEGLRWDEWRASGKNKRAGAEERIGHKPLYARLSEISESFKRPVRELLPICAYYGGQRGRIEEPKRLRENKNNYDHPTSALSNALNPLTDFREMLAWFDREEASELRKNKGLKPEQWKASLALDAVREAIRLLLNDDYGNPYFNDQHRFVVVSKTSETPLRVTQLSQGYQSMLALGMDFARRLALGNDHLDIKDNKAAVDDLLERLQRLDRSMPGLGTGVATKFAPAVMLIDEIDLHLHPAWQQRVLADLMRAFPGTQFIVTTHSPQVLTSVDAACIRLIQEEPDPETAGRSFSIQSGFAQTKGVASSDLLAEIMGVNPIPDLPEARMVSSFHALIQQNLHNTNEGGQLRARLSAHFGDSHPVLRECDRMIRLQGFKQKLPLPTGQD
ncbi:AAA family ATPase [Aquimonas sp.]|jgi:predicted ATP-binding protein involved in virulence|uniref:AAA family ATPase n=1 Tax=Aquimonas sp. TaxID=1872588 RepID=UPI0037BF11C6